MCVCVYFSLILIRRARRGTGIRVYVLVRLYAPTWPGISIWAYPFRDLRLDSVSVCLCVCVRFFINSPSVRVCSVNCVCATTKATRLGAQGGKPDAGRRTHWIYGNLDCLQQTERSLSGELVSSRISDFKHSISRIHDLSRR